MAKNLIDFLDDDDFEIDENPGQRKFKLPREEQGFHRQKKKQITQERKKKRKQKEDILTLRDENEN